MERLKDGEVELCRLFLLETRFVFLFLRDNKEIKDNNEIKVKKNSKKISAYQPNF